MGRFLDKRVLITGGARGIGAAAARLFASEGALLWIWDKDPAGEALAESLQTQGYAVSFSQVDISNVAEINAGVEQLIAQASRIDALINNAGITRDKSLLKLSPADWDAVISVNLSGVFHCTRAVVPYMREQQYGRIVSTSSVVGLRGNFGQTNYAAAKAGIIAMTKTWALELGKYGITANCVAPGFIDTEMTAAIPDAVKQHLLAGIPLQRMGKAEEVAEAYAFLASDQAAYISGTCLSVDGGVSR